MFTSLASSLLVAGALAAPAAQNAPAPNRGLWQPEIGVKWQIVISSPVDTSQRITPSDAEIMDVDLFATSAEDVSIMQRQGKKVICYFSAGSAENWRPDYRSFSRSDLGSGLEGWEGENWLNIRSSSVLDVMKKRIQLAKQKGCDAIDPDNMDGYSNGGGGFNLQPRDTISYLRGMSSYAAGLGMSTGLKNAQEVLSDEVYDMVQFAINEECVSQGDPETACEEYNDMLAAGKPVLHIEYLDDDLNSGDSGDDNSGEDDSGEEQSKSQNRNGTAIVTSGEIPRRQLERLCNNRLNGESLSTVIKYLDLDGYVTYCDGSTETTATNDEEGDEGDEGDDDAAPQQKKAGKKAGRKAGKKSAKKAGKKSGENAEKKST